MNTLHARLGPATSVPPAPAADPARAEIVRVASESMIRYHLRAIIVRVTQHGRDLYTGAMGYSMPGVPATPQMHFRNGAMAFTYIGEIYAELVDRKKLRLDDKLSMWMPQLAHANEVTIKNLLNMTSGYADYVYQPQLQTATLQDPFRQWTTDELIDIGVSRPLQFRPGTNWAYSHTNYAILGRLLEIITGQPLAQVMQRCIIGPMGLANTSDNDGTPAIPDPVLHTYSSERRSALQIPPSVPFTEDTTFWNPSWTTATGAVETTNIYDMATSMRLVGDGQFVSPAMYKAQTGPNLVGFGHRDPSEGCPACAENTTARSYGLGVILRGPWITQTKNFYGNGASAGYLPAQDLTIAVSVTYNPQAFDNAGDYANASASIFTAIATALAPNQAPSSP